MNYLKTWWKTVGLPVAALSVRLYARFRRDIRAARERVEASGISPIRHRR